MRTDREGVTIRIALGIIMVSIAMLAVMAADETRATPPDNYDWAPSAELNEEDENQSPDYLLRDGYDERIYLMYTRWSNASTGDGQPPRQYLVVFDEVNRTFGHPVEIPTADFRDAMMYQGHLYRVTFNALTGETGILVDDEETPKALMTFPEDNAGVSWFELLDIKDGKIRMIAVLSYALWYPHYTFWFNIEYLEIDLDTYQASNQTIQRVDQRTYDQMEIHFNNGQVYVLWEDEDIYSPWIQCYVYDPDVGTGSGPNRIHLNDDNTGGDWWYADVDGQGDIHIYFADNGPSMYKYSPDGTLRASIDLADLLYPLTYPTYGYFPFVVNETGFVHLFYSHYQRTYIRNLVIDPDYSDYRTEAMIIGDFNQWGTNAILNGTDRVIVCWVLEDYEVRKIWSTCQTPLAPDLEVDPATFSYVEEDIGQEEGLSFSVRNIGRATAASFIVNVSWRKADTDIFGVIGHEQVVEPLARMGAHAFEFPTDLAGGNYALTIEITTVKPLENRLKNNVFEAWINVRNKAPQLDVLWPHDGMEVGDSLYIEGRTVDREDPDSVTTLLMGPGTLQYLITGSGEWNHTINTSQVASGVYGLLFIASDGIKETRVTRTIMIDHPTKTLTISDYAPGIVPELIVGEVQGFRFKAEDLFGRPIYYTWAMNGDVVAENVTSYSYVAEMAGEHSLRVEATNGRHTLSYDWTVPVRDPIAPTIGQVRPEGDQSVLKGGRIDFEVAVDNPDDRAYSITWTVDSAVLAGDVSTFRTIDFPDSGDHMVRATLVAVEGVSIIHWKVAVENRPPTVLGASPEEDIITITEAVEMTFLITAEDPDGDDLAYSWSSDGLDLRDLGGPEGAIDLPCKDEGSLTIIATVSDGEAEATMEWTIIMDPPEPPVNLPPYLVSLNPTEETIPIDRQTVINFAVVATDPEGVDLTYEWGSDRFNVDPMNGSSYDLRCPCTDEERYTIWVTVSDGEHSFRTEWTVDAKPRAEPVDMQNGHLPIELIAALVIAVSAATIGYLYWRKTNSSDE
jgi:hypothetical protein